MALPWVRLDANISSHDKVLDLLSRPNGHRAFTLYICALGWSGGQGSDGVIPRLVLPMVHGTPKLADLLVDVGLFEHAEAGAYVIRNWNLRQETSVVREVKRELQKQGARRTNCQRWHGKDCGCWQRPESEAS
jgi:hypothetical protein